MEENREPLSAIAIEKKLQLLRNKHFSEDTIALVKSDYEYGLTEEEISLYLNKSYDIEQMKILSECLHKDVPKDVMCRSCLEKVRLIRSQAVRQRADREALQETMMY